MSAWVVADISLRCSGYEAARCAAGWNCAQKLNHLAGFVPELYADFAWRSRRGFSWVRSHLAGQKRTEPKAVPNSIAEAVINGCVQGRFAP